MLAGMLLASSAAVAQPTAVLGPGNVGITAFGFAFDGGSNTITLRETYGVAGAGSILIDGLSVGVNYTVIKLITNSSGSDWSSMANELFAPGPGVPGQPTFVPPGFQPSDDFDGLSFAQGSGLPRTSTIFPNVTVDELADRDYLDFFGAIWADGTFGEITFGLRTNNADSQPFLLFQRPNEFTTVIPVPAALPLLLSGLGLLGFLARRRQQQA